jgi:hypothetical protein
MPTGRFTDGEREQLKKLLRAGRDIRGALRNLETNIWTTAEDTRRLLAVAEHAATECDEGVVNALLFLAGTAAERDDKVRDDLRRKPRAEFRRRAYNALDEAVHEGEEALEAIDAAALVRTTDDDYQLHLRRAKFQTAETVKRIRAFDRTLGYDTPPAQAVLFLDQAWQSVGQYGYDITIDLEAAFLEGAPLSAEAYRAWGTALSQVWLQTDQVMNCVSRAIGIEILEGEDPVEASLRDLLFDAPQHLHVVQVSLDTIQTQTNADVSRPVLARMLSKARIDLSDDWRHLDFGAQLWALRAVLAAD